MKSKLESAVQAQDALYKENPKFKQSSINDEAMSKAINLSHAINLEMKDEGLRHIITMRQLSRKNQNICDAITILSGVPGFLRCPQGWSQIESGYTTLQEVVSKLTEPFIDISIDPMSAPYGMELWQIDDRGLMTLICCTRDSSD